MTDIKTAIQNVCVYCGSSPGNHPRYIELAKATGLAISNAELRMVYGGGALGLMGATAKAAHENGGKVLGIIPDFLVHAEGAYTEAEKKEGLLGVLFLSRF